MNLRIAENIKRLRQESQLTQAQLAERLGVSYQAVSRWENETTYPDIELLPSIAALFGVTVDYLLGSTAENQRESLMRDWDKLKTITDPHARVTHLRMMHRDFPEDMYLFLKLCMEVPSMEEKRRLTAELLRDCAIPYIRALAIRQLICAEDEDKVMALMYDYNILEECWDELLEHRYRTRGETEKCLRQRRIIQ
jgi:transcriptional regulator with XRE-family HTH domain